MAVRDPGCTESIGPLVVKIVADKDFSHTSEEKLRGKLADRVGNKVNITMEQVQNIPREVNGKFNAVISELPAHERR